MISDVLFEAVAGLDFYLNSDNRWYRDWYSGNLRERLLRLRAEMDAIRHELDTGRPAPAVISE